MNLQARHAYAAGLLDGEGTVVIRKDGMVHVEMSNTFLPAVDYMASMYGGTVHARKLRNGWRQSYVWQVRGQLACRALEQMLPFLLIKREQAKLAIKYRADKIVLPRKDKAARQCELDRREKIRLAISNLNQGVS
jgi:hypothetical protein